MTPPQQSRTGWPACIFMQLPQQRRGLRTVQLVIGLVLFGFSLALMFVSGLGVNPWDVFHAGVAKQTSLTIGEAVIVAGVLVLLAWWPLRQRIGWGTLSNALVVGLVLDFFLRRLHTPSDPGEQWVWLLSGLVLNAAATAMYLGVGFGPGPRDGLMTGLARRTGWPVGRIRTAIELVVLTVGVMLGGAVGLGTLVFAVLIGPIVQRFLPVFDVDNYDPRGHEEAVRCWLIESRSQDWSPWLRWGSEP